MTPEQPKIKSDVLEYCKTIGLFESDGNNASEMVARVLSGKRLVNTPLSHPNGMDSDHTRLQQLAQEEAAIDIELADIEQLISKESL